MSAGTFNPHHSYHLDAVVVSLDFERSALWRWVLGLCKRTLEARYLA